MKKFALLLAIISLMVFSMMASFNSVNALQSVSEGSTKTTITLNESVDFWVDVKPSSRINWYCDDLLVKSEYSLHSNYTFTPKATGTYLIGLSVAGFTKPSGPTKVTVISAPISSSTPQLPKLSSTPTIIVAPTPYSTYHKGDPYGTVYSPSEIAPPYDTKPPIITIIAPINNTMTASNNLTLAFNLTLEGLTSYHPITLQRVCYKTSWQSENVTLQIDSHNQFVNKTLSLSITLTDIPEGSQSIIIYANALCEYETGRENKQVIYGPGEFLKEDLLYIYSNYYFIGGSSSAEFTIDATPITTPSVNTDSGLDYKTNILLYTIGVITLLIVAAGLLVYHKKHKGSLIKNS